MRSTSSSACASAGLLLLLSACSLAPPPAHPRPPLPAQAAVAPQPVATPALTRLESRSDYRWHGTLQGCGETVDFELWGERGVTTPRPFVLLVPILAGGSYLMEFVAEAMYERGFDVAFCDRAGSAMSEGQRGPDLQELFRRTVLHQRLLLQWLRRSDDATPRQQYVLGISLGGMVATSVAAHEPDIAGVAVCLSGGDLKSLVLCSEEPRVKRWVDWRLKTDGVGADHLCWELHEHLHFEPVAMAGAVATDKVLFVSAGYDDVVPEANQDLLWEALGRPTRMRVPLGHYTSVLAIGSILTAAADHFMARQPGATVAKP